MKIKREFIEHLRNTYLAKDFVESAFPRLWEHNPLTLNRAGTCWVALSPFSEEKSPSFRIPNYSCAWRKHTTPHRTYPAGGLFYCYSSGRGGDIFRFCVLDKVMYTGNEDCYFLSRTRSAYEPMNFYEAVKFVARHYGETVEYEEKSTA